MDKLCANLKHYGDTIIDLKQKEEAAIQTIVKTIPREYWPRIIKDMRDIMNEEKATRRTLKERL